MNLRSRSSRSPWRHITGYVAVISLLLMAGGPLALGQQTVLWSDSFDDGDVGDWTIDNPCCLEANPITLETTTEQYVSPGYGLKVSAPAAGWYCGEATGPDVPVDMDQPYTVEFSFRWGDFHWYKPLLFGPIHFFLDYPHMPLKYYDGTTHDIGPAFQSYCPADTWTYFRIEVDPISSSYDVYADDQLIGTADYDPGYTTGFQGFNFKEHGCNDHVNYLTNGYYDDLVVSSGTPPPPTGACCVDFTCVVTNTEPECGILGGVWHEGETCPEFECPTDIYTFYPTDDTFVKMNDEVYGHNEHLQIRNESTGIWEEDVLIRFDLSDIPSGTSVESATLHLWYYDFHDSTPANRVLTSHRILEDWDEDTVTGDTLPDYTSEPCATSVVPGQTGEWMTWDMSTEVQYFLDNPGANDYGWLIKDPEYWAGGDIPRTLFRSKEYGEFVPYLVVSSASGDCNDNGIPDECDIDCGEPGGPCDLPGCGQSEDCQPNGVPDECDVAPGDLEIITGPGYSVGDGPRVVASADFNGDEHPDLVAAVFWAQQVTVLMNNGDGTFAAGVPYSTGGQARSVAAADLNHDDHPDLAVAAFNGFAAVLINNGDGTFAAPVHYAAGGQPYSIAAADFNGDTHIDLAVANQTSDDVSVFLNNGDGTFAEAVPYAVGDRPWSVVAFDLDGDDIPDLAVANVTSHDVSVLLNHGDGTFADSVEYAAGWAPYTVTAADLDGDLDGDLAVTNTGSDDVSVLLNNGDGTFAEAVHYAVGHEASSVAAADLNGDTHPDLAVAVGTDDIVAVLLNNGDGTFAEPVNFSAGNEPRSVIAVDLDGDDVLDLATANYLSDNVVVLFNETEPPFSQDLNGDGIPDECDDVPIISTEPPPGTPLTPTCVEGYNATEQTFEVWNGGGGTLNYTITLDDDWAEGDWLLSVVPPDGSSDGGHIEHTVHYNTVDLPVGTHYGTITISDPNASNDPQTIPVELTVEDPPLPIIERSPETLTNQCEEGEDAVEQTFEVWNGGVGMLEYTITVEDCSTDPCFISSIVPPDGTSEGEHNIHTVYYDTDTLDCGMYYATIVISDPDAENNPQTIPVELTVGGPPTICTEPVDTLDTHCGFWDICTGDVIEVWNCGQCELSYTTSVEYDPSGVNWLSIDPPTGTSDGEHITHTLTYDTHGLASGETYLAMLTISDPEATNDPLTITVSLYVGFWIGGPVFYDEGIPMFSGVPGVTATVDGDGGTFTACTSDDGQGIWSVNNLPEGTYTVTLTKDGCAFFRNGSGGESPPITIIVDSDHAEENGNIRFYTECAPGACCMSAGYCIPDMQFHACAGIPDAVYQGNGSTCDDPCEYDDCDANGVLDSVDIDTSCLVEDCQPNGVPDDCDIDPTDPDGNGQVSLDENGNGIPDECECPADVTILAATPVGGAVDARQPNPTDSLTPRQGIGDASNPITIDLGSGNVGLVGCFALCETAEYPGDPNVIAEVLDNGDGTYTITLARGITAGAVTTIQYLGDGSYVEYTAHPANANADSAAGVTDITALINYLNEADTPPFGLLSSDIDHSGVFGSTDITRLIDLLNGAGVYDPWMGTPLPVNSGDCP